MKDYLLCQEGLIKSLLIMPESLKDVAGIITESDIQDSRYNAIYKAMLEMDFQGQQYNLPTILEKIKFTPNLIISPDWVFALDVDAADFLREGHPASWATMLKDEVLREKAPTIITKMTNKLNERNLKPSNIVDEGIKELNDLRSKYTHSNVKTVNDVYLSYEEKRHVNSPPISSPYETVDKYIGGWKAGDLITVGAQTGVGKTSVAIQQAIKTAEQGKTVLFYSLEMTEDELIEKMIACIARIDTRTLDDGILSDDEEVRYIKARNCFLTLPILINDKSTITIEDIKSTAMNLHLSTGLDMIIVDYLQLITPTDVKQTREQTVAEFSRKLKILAKDIKIPIMILVQLNRKSSGDDDERLPRLDDIRESAAVAMDSTIILLLHRPDIRENKIDEFATFIIDKNRKGPRRFVKMRCQLEYSSFESVNTEEETAD